MKQTPSPSSTSAEEIRNKDFEGYMASCQRKLSPGEWEEFRTIYNHSWDIAMKYFQAATPDQASTDLVKLNCMVCGKEFMGKEPVMCCSGRDCGCMGMPIDPIVCSEECYNNLPFKKHQASTQGQEGKIDTLQKVHILSKLMQEYYDSQPIAGKNNEEFQTNLNLLLATLYDKYISPANSKAQGQSLPLQEQSEDFNLERLYEWIMDENRERGITKFTSGTLRNIAKEIEYRLWKQGAPSKAQVQPDLHFSSSGGGTFFGNLKSTPQVQQTEPGDTISRALSERQELKSYPPPQEHPAPTYRSEMDYVELYSKFRENDNMANSIKLLVREIRHDAKSPSPSQEQAPQVGGGLQE